MQTFVENVEFRTVTPRTLSRQKLKQTNSFVPTQAFRRSCRRIAQRNSSSFALLDMFDRR